MGALPVVPNVLKLTIGGDQGPYTWVNALHWSYTGGAPSATDADNIAETLYTAWVAQFAPLMAAGTSILEATCVDLTSDLGASGANSGSTIGSRAGVTVSPALAVLISKTIARRYRGGHPRMYIVAGVQDDLGGPAEWTSGLQGDVQAAWTAVSAILNAYVTGTTTLAGEVTVSYISKAVNPVAPYRRPVPLVLPVSAHVTQTHVAVQRRRMGR